MKSRYTEIFEYAEMFLRHKWLVILPAITAAALLGVYSWMLPNYYRSSTLILVEHQRISESYVKATDTTPIANRLNTIKQQILSRTRLSQIIKRFNLYSNDESVGQRSIVASLPVALQRWIKDDVDSKGLPVERMKKNVDVSVMGRGGGGGDAFSISYVGTDPEKVMLVTNALAELFIKENLKIREGYIEGTTNFLASELEKARKKLKTRERELRTFKESHRGSLPSELNTNLRTLDRLQLELQTVGNSINSAHNREQVLVSQTKYMKAAGASGAPVVMGSLNPIEDELYTAKQELIGLRATYKESYPDVIILKNRIRRLEQAMNEEGKITPANGDESVEDSSVVKNSVLYKNLLEVQAQLRTLQTRRGEIFDAVRVYEKRVEEIPANEQKLTNIKRDYDILLANYQELLKKKLDASLAENLEKNKKGERFRVIDTANLPKIPYSPKRAQNVFAGGFAGATAGVLLVLLLETLNPVVRKPEDLMDLIAKPVLGVIPRFKESLPTEGVAE